jgi:dTDP-4-amino-4,6-dideoxygalactose transaminase
MIPFNKPYLSGKELVYIEDAVKKGKISGNGYFTQKCHDYFQTQFGFKKVLLTTSCTDALEMAAILLNIKAGDEVIMPAYTFVSPANAFVLRGAKVVFADSRKDHPGMDEASIEALITNKTKAIVVVHYAGIATDMDSIMAVAKKHHLFVVEDAAQAIDSYYKGKALGSIGHLAAFSFHETKNIQCGEGGMLVINDEQFVDRAEIIWEKGTNRNAFFRGEVDKYGWVDIGSSFLPSELNAAYLFAQLEQLSLIQQKRKEHWQQYQKALSNWAKINEIELPFLPDYATNNGHMYYLICKNIDQRTALIQHLKDLEVWSVFHYISLHSSPYFQAHHDGRALPNSDYFSDCLIRLPLFFELNPTEVISKILAYES